MSSKYSHNVPLVLTLPSNRSHLLSRANTVCSGQFKVQHHAQRWFPPEFHKLRLCREVYVPPAARSLENQHIAGEPQDHGTTAGNKVRRVFLTCKKEVSGLIFGTCLVLFSSVSAAKAATESRIRSAADVLRILNASVSGWEAEFGSQSTNTTTNNLLQESRVQSFVFLKMQHIF